MFFDRGAAAVGIRHSVVELEKPRLFASACCSHELATAGVTLPDGALHGRRYAPGMASSLSTGARAVSRGELRSLQLHQQGRECPIEDGCRVAVRDGMTQQVLHAPQLVVCVARHRELDVMAAWRQRTDHRWLWHRRLTRCVRERNRRWPDG